MVVRETERLILRTLTEDDLEPLVAIHADPDVMRFIGGVRARGRTEARLRELIADQARLGFSKWAVVLRSTGELIGRCGPMVEPISACPRWRWATTSPAGTGAAASRARQREPRSPTV